MDYTVIAMKWSTLLKSSCLCITVIFDATTKFDFCQYVPHIPCFFLLDDHFHTNKFHTKLGSKVTSVLYYFINNIINSIMIYHNNIVYLAVPQENEQRPAEKEAADKEGKQQLPPFLSLSLSPRVTFPSRI